MRDLAKQCGATTYVSVDRFHPGEPDPLRSLREETLDGLHEIEVCADMLDFLTHIKDNIGNFAINGIDELVIPNQAYRQALAQELIRVTRKGGIIFGINSDIPLNMFSGGEKAQLRFIPKMPIDNSDVFVFEKME